MDIQARADAIALIAAKNTLKRTLRQPPGIPLMSVANCVEQLTNLLVAELKASEMARFAAIATYKANLYREQVNTFTAALSTLLESVNSDASTAVRSKNLRRALVKLEAEHPLVWVGVDLGQIIGRTLKASDAGKKSKTKSDLVKAYAIDLFAARTWKSTRSAKDALWPLVLAEANRVGWSVAPTQGPLTLYKWLLAHKKSTLSAS